MKNLFIKQNNNGMWIAAAVTGVITAGTVAWLYIKRSVSKSDQEEHATDYLKPKPAKHKKTTDVQQLHNIVAG